MTYKISKLILQNYRNIISEKIDFSDGFNCVFGDNGNGKTNILEAIYYLSNKKSFRKNTFFPQLLSINSEKPEILISASLKNSENQLLSYSMKFSNLHHNYSIDGINSKKKINFEVIYINPFDSNYFHTSSSFRRNIIDKFMSLMDKKYKKTLNNYNNVLRNRNILLSKKNNKYLEQIKAIDEQFVDYSIDINIMRSEFINEINHYLKNIFNEIFSQNHLLKISLKSSFIGKSKKEIFKILHENLPKDEILGHTTHGIHRDDYLFFFDELNSFDYCSLGQQKMSYLSLLFAYIELFRYKYMAYPIVLLDDISGELDKLRWQRLVQYFEDKKFQIIITTANEKFKEELDKIKETKKFLVSSGKVTEI